MKVLHLSPYYFSSESVLGGGERYAYELAKAMAKKTETVFLSFSKNKSVRKNGALREVYFPALVSIDFFKWLHWADVIHCHQLLFPHTDWAILFGKFLSPKKVFATDLGGSQPRCLARYFPLHQCLDALLLISDYSRKFLSENSAFPKPKRMEVVYGGVDTHCFTASSKPKEPTILYVGRMVSHKGIEYLIDAVDDGFELQIIGKVYEEPYYQYLQKKAVGKKISFHHDVTDEALISKYQTAAVVVQPSVYKNYEGQYTRVPELLGLTTLEALACATPVIVSNVASLPELVRDGETGFVVPANDAKAIREKIKWLFAHPNEAARMGERGRQTVLQKFTWEKTAERCLRAYTQDDCRVAA